MELKFVKRDVLKEKPTDETKLGFGRIFTDYMLMMKRDGERGWYSAQIEPYGDLQLSPAALVLHYAQEVFEGMKAYKTDDGRVLMFRPWDNIKRLATSAERICMAPFDQEFVLNSLYELIKIEKDWIPTSPGTSLYSMLPGCLPCRSMWRANMSVRSKAARAITRPAATMRPACWRGKRPMKRDMIRFSGWMARKTNMWKRLAP